MRLTDVAVAVSKSAGQRLVELKSTPPDKLRIVPNGIHVGPFRERNDAARARLAGSLGLPSTTQLVGFVGRLNWADRKSTRLNSSHSCAARMPTTAGKNKNT